MMFDIEKERAVSYTLDFIIDDFKSLKDRRTTLYEKLSFQGQPKAHATRLR